VSVFLPYQAAWYARKSPLRVCEKSRRVGITWCEAARQVLLASRSRSQGGANCYYLSTSQKLGREYIDACAHWVRHLGMAASTLGAEMVDDRTAISKEEIRFKSGFCIRALTSNPESMRGMGGDVIIDEAAHHLDLHELLKAAQSLGDWGDNSLTVISTHNGSENPFALLCEEIRTGEREGILSRITIEDALRDGLHRRRCLLKKKPWSQESEDAWLAKKLKGWGSEEEYLVIPSRNGTTFLRRDIIEACSILTPIHRVSKDSEHHKKAESTRISEIENWCRLNLDNDLRKIPHGQRSYVGVDFARSLNGDLSVIAVITEQRDLQKNTTMMVEMRNVPFEEQWRILRHIGKGLGKSFGGVSIDKVGNGQWLAEQATIEWGESRVTGVRLCNEWYGANLPRFRTSFEEGTIKVPADTDVRDDLMMFEVRGGIPKMSESRRSDSKDGKKRHGDAGIALALAYSRCLGAPPDIEFTRMPGSRENPGPPRRTFM